eukprot:TRINITY_DN38439_c0_g1_i1.p1 TRINITY_DN38439_c0_g1~~TRINITY_DN38439_c0_g1_i1.p1  ORF type:complete len:428 (+),score=38.90 TRINITY_DN38439_c0_g1_i1:120-1403(+)
MVASFARRLVSLAVGICIMLLAGVAHSVGVWGGDLVAAAGWSQSHLPTFKSLLDLGLFVSSDIGLLLDYWGESGREWAGALLAGTLMCTGWSTLFVAARVGGVPASVGAIAFYCIGHGMFAAFAGALRANSLNFGHRYEGRIDCLLLASFGAAAALFSSIYAEFYGKAHISGLIGLFSVLSVVLPTLFALFTVRVRSELSHFKSADGAQEALMSRIRKRITFPACHVFDRRPVELLRMDNFWRLWLILFLSGGANVAFSQSVDLFIGDASTSKAALVSCFSLFNMLARCCGGVVADMLFAAFDGQGRERGGRLLLAVLSALVMSLAAELALRGAGHELVLKAAFSCIGLSEGLLFAAWCSSVRDLFGPLHFGCNLSMANTAFGIGAGCYLQLAEGRGAETLVVWARVACPLAAVLALSLFWRPHQLW